jgi:adenylate cyclase class 2
MFEVELKVRADHGPVRERLDALGAERVEHVRQADTYYDAPHRDFAETDEALRIRRETPLGGGAGAGGDAREGEGADGAGDGPEDDEVDAGGDIDGDDGGPADVGVGSARVTYKGPLVDEDSKTRREFETGVDDGETMASVLDGLGFAPAAVVEKERERYRVDGYVVTLDAVAGLGEFVEVEREVSEGSVDAAREGAYDLLDRLGLDGDATIRTSYLGLSLAADADRDNP